MSQETMPVWSVRQGGHILPCALLTVADHGQQRRGGHRPRQAQAEITQGVGVGRAQLCRVADEREVLHDFPEDRGCRAEPDAEEGSVESVESELAKRQNETARQDGPVDKMIGVVPPANGVVEVECVACRVDEER